MDLGQLVAVWLHTVAFVIAWGWYGILGRIVLPTLEGSLDGPTRATTLLALERRALPLVLVSVGLFVATGTYLLVVDDRYAGLGDFFANGWTTLMLAKHVVVAVLVVLGVAVDFLVRRVAGASDEATRRSSFRLLRLSAEGATAVGALIALLTGAAHLSA